jgi:hypothetical protein
MLNDMEKRITWKNTIQVPFHPIFHINLIIFPKVMLLTISTLIHKLWISLAL